MKLTKSKVVQVKCNTCGKIKKRTVKKSTYSWARGAELDELKDNLDKDLQALAEKQIANGVICRSCEYKDSFFIWQLVPGDRLMDHKERLIAVVEEVYMKNHSVQAIFYNVAINAITFEHHLVPRSANMSFKSSNIENWGSIYKVWRDGEIIWEKK